MIARFLFVPLLFVLADQGDKIVGDIAEDFLKIFHDIKQIRSTIPKHAFDVTFDQAQGRSLLKDTNDNSNNKNINNNKINNNKRTTIMNPREELRDTLDQELINSPLASDVITTDFQTRHGDPLHKRHGVGEGLASLPDNYDVTGAVRTLPNASDNSTAVENNKNSTADSSPNKNSTAEHISNDSSNSTRVTSSNDQVKNTSSILKTLGELKGLESQINDMMENRTSNGTRHGDIRYFC